jgi:oxalate decarboxylase/phosphoglucose isomerase-like protein (cupin superfamily)
MVGRFDVREGEAPPYHKHTHEDEVFMLIKGTALVWVDDQEMERGLTRLVSHRVIRNLSQIPVISSAARRRYRDAEVPRTPGAPSALALSV